MYVFTYCVHCACAPENVCPMVSPKERNPVNYYGIFTYQYLFDDFFQLFIHLNVHCSMVYKEIAECQELLLPVNIRNSLN